MLRKLSILFFECVTNIKIRGCTMNEKIVIEILKLVNEISHDEDELARCERCNLKKDIERYKSRIERKYLLIKILNEGKV